MAIPTFPAFLESPTITSYGYQDHDVERVMTRMESGHTRRRQRAPETPADFPARFVFSLLQLQIFEYFFENILKSGTLEFEMDLKTGQGTITHTVKFSAPPTQRKIGKKYEVMCKIEAESRPSA